MAEPEQDEQAEQQPGTVRANPGRVIGKLTTQIANLSQELAITASALEEQVEANAALRAELVAVTTARQEAEEAAPAPRPAAAGKARAGR